MATIIRMTPDELREAAEFIVTQRESISNEVNALISKINETADGWEGAAQSSFLDSFENNFKPVLEKDFPEMLTGLSEQLRAAADAIEDADEQVASALRG